MDLKYSDEFFDLVIDKSTLDCMMCCDNSQLVICKMLKECQRVLKTNGIYVVISLENLENREFIFQMEHVSFEIEYV